MILPETGRGTMHCMVEGQVRVLLNFAVIESRTCPSTSYAGLPPPAGED